MKKTYNEPTLKVVRITTQHLMAGSGEGVTDGAKLGNEFNSSDVPYSKDNNTSLWGEEE